MKRRLTILLLVAGGSGVATLGLFAAERRGPRASHTLARELASLHEQKAPRVPHVSAPLPGSTAELLKGQFASCAPGSDAGAVVEVARILEATRAASGGLPDGLAAATAGVDSWDAVARVEPSVVAGIDSVPRCLDALALGRDLAVGGGLQGLSAAHRLTVAALPACAKQLDAPGADKPDAARALQSLLDSAPSLAHAFREADLDLQLRFFGGWMRPEDLQELAPATRLLASSAPPRSVGFFARHRLLGAWVKLTKNERAAEEALSLRPRAREERLAELEQAAREPSLALPWRDGLRHHEERLALLRLLRLAARLEAARAETGQWRTLGELEAAEVSAVAQGGALELRLRGTQWSVVLQPD